jgi:RNA polymerase sigma-70 factor (ECF subfamily)
MAEPYLNKDAELIQRIKDRDQAALVELYECHRYLVYNMAMQVLRDPASAEEITQDVFFQVWRWPERWDADRGRFTSWILTVTRYTAIDHLRRENRQPPRTPHSLEHLAELLGRAPSFDNARSDNGRALRQLVKTLPAEQRDLIIMAFFQGLSHSEMAERLGLPLGTVKSRIRLGLQKLKDAWFEHVEPPHEE